jgi:hypothetical protein
MTKQQFIGNYLQKKLKDCKLGYGMNYLNKVATLEAEAEKLWKERKKKRKK